MGFSVQQAQTALIATLPSSGSGEWDVQAALEVLMEQAGGGGGGGGSEQQTGENDSDDDEEGMPRFRRDYDDDDDDVRPPPPSTRRHRPPSPPHPAPSAPAPATGRRAREAAAAAASSSSSERDTSVEDRAAELLAQASKIGFSVFKSANQYWETGRATLQKKIGEVVADVAPPSSHEGSAEGGAGAGRRVHQGQQQRPKWMTDDGPQQSSKETMRSKERRPVVEQTRKDEPQPSLFQDSDDDEPRPAPPQQQPRPSSSRQPPPPTEAPPADYRSPWRRPQNPSPSPSPSPAPLSTPSPPTRRPTPPRPTRPLIPVPPQALSSSLSHKETGNAHYKLGRFSEAATSYSLGISLLPPLSLPLLPLLNNRAAARLQSGDANGAIEDCSMVLQIVLGETGIVGGRIDVVGLASEKEGGDLVGQLAKALGKRAKAYESAEKWDKAKDDYEVLRGAGEAVAKAAGGTKLIAEGLARCRQMLAPPPPPPTSSLAPSSAPRRTRTPTPTPPTNKPPPPAVLGSGDAVRALRSAADAQALEDDLRLTLKDSVDAKIQSWKGGKEANLRALIASLDSVLWPELEWKKVGMHELVSEGQVKVRYVRAIAKLHPDKLSVGSTTVEQRMIGGSVFAALNEAWNAKK